MTRQGYIGGLGKARAEKTFARVYSIADVLKPIESGPGAGTLNYDTLIDAVVDTIAPQSWDDVGGPGSIKGVPSTGSLVINQTEDVHEQIDQLLRDLRKTLRIDHGRQGLVSNVKIGYESPPWMTNPSQ